MWKVTRDQWKIVSIERDIANKQSDSAFETTAIKMRPRHKCSADKSCAKVLSLHNALFMSLKRRTKVFQWISEVISFKGTRKIPVCKLHTWRERCSASIHDLQAVLQNQESFAYAKVSSLSNALFMSFWEKELPHQASSWLMTALTKITTTTSCKSTRSEQAFTFDLLYSCVRTRSFTLAAQYKLTMRGEYLEVVQYVSWKAGLKKQQVLRLSKPSI